MYRFFLFLFLPLLCCSSWTPKKTYQVGQDPFWSPFDFKDQRSYVNGFVDEVVYHIGKKEGLLFNIENSSTSALFHLLKTSVYDAVLSNLTPDMNNQHFYDFSDPLLLTGPVLVTRQGSSIHTLDDLSNRLVGISRYDQSFALVAHTPSALSKPYDRIEFALEDLERGALDAVLMPTLEAEALLHLHPSLQIASKPLTSEGIRLLVLKETHSSLLASFNQGLHKLSTSGDLTQLRREFKLEEKK